MLPRSAKRVKVVMVQLDSLGQSEVSVEDQCILISSLLFPQILACQGAAVSVGGIYPLLYPTLG